MQFPFHRLTFGFCFLVLAASWPGTARAQNNPRSEQTDKDKGTIQGVVTRAGSGEPIAGALVRLSDTAGFQDLINLITAQSITTLGLPTRPESIAEDSLIQTIVSTASARGVKTESPEFQSALARLRAAASSRLLGLSDQVGRFTINNVPPGSYEVLAEREGYFGGTVNSGAGTAATRSAIVTAGRTTDISISLIQGATISGKVTLRDTPQIGINVQAFSVSYENGYQVLQPAVAKSTDDRGQFRLFFLSPGEYLVAALPRQTSGPRMAATAATAVANADQQVRTFYPGTAEGGNAIPIVVRGSEEVPGIDIAIRTEKTYRVSGEIHSYVPRGALRESNVTAEIGYALHDPNVPDDVNGRTIGSVSLQQDGNGLSGKFEIVGVLPGSYDWRASVYEAPADGVLQPSTTILPIEVRSGDVTGLVFDIYQTVTVAGQVTIDGHAPGPSPVRVWLQVEGASAKRPGYRAIASRIATANTQDGSFKIPGIQMGRFRIMTDGLAPDIYIEDVRQGGQSVFDSGFLVAHDTPAPAQVLLRSGAGTITGSVEDSSRNAVFGATVALIPTATFRQNRARYQTAKSDATGQFTIRNIIPGTYELFAWPDIANGSYFNPRFLARFEGLGRTVAVQQSSKLRMNLVSFPDGR